MQVHALGEVDPVLQQVHKGRLITRPSEVVELEFLSPRIDLVGHTQQRRHTDASGNQDVPVGALRDREQISRLADLDVVAGAHLVQRHRSTTGLRFPLHGDQQRRRVAGRAAQRVLAQHTGGADHVDVGARLIPDERGAVLASQPESADVRRLLDDLRHPHEHAHSRNPAAGTSSLPSMRRITLRTILSSCAVAATRIV